MGVRSMNCSAIHPRTGDRPTRRGFSLVEVMIAVGIFFMVAFTVLALVSRCLKQAAALEQVRSPIGSLAAQTTATNRLEEGVETGSFDDAFPDYRWTREVVVVTNDLYDVYLSVIRTGQGKPEAELVLRLYRPAPAPGPAGRRRR